MGDKTYEIERFEKELKQIESKCIHHRQTVATIDSALPILHSDKTTAVNNENYLEAGKIHKQIQHKVEQIKMLNEKCDQIKQKLRDEKGQQIQLKQELENIKIKIHKQRFELIMEHRITIKESLSFYDDDDVDDVEKTVLNLELNQFEQELEFSNQTYGWNVEYKEREIIHINNAEEHDQEENNNDSINNNVNDIGDNND